MNRPDAPIKFRYKNHEGKTRVRTAIIKRVWFGSTHWHKEPQWMMRAFCTEHNANRDFAIADCDFLSFSGEYSGTPAGFTGKEWNDVIDHPPASLCSLEAALKLLCSLLLLSIKVLNIVNGKNSTSQSKRKSTSNKAPKATAPMGSN